MSSTALLIGATGLIGKLLLPDLLTSSHFNRVGEFGRRVTKPAPPGADGKLVQRTIDFEKLGDSGLKDESWDVVYITLGTTKAIAGSKAAFTKIDKEYVVNAAREARVPGRKQRLVYVSSALISTWSPIFFSRSKALTEAALAEIGYDEFISLRPGVFLNFDRSGTNREGEVLPGFLNILAYFLPWIDVHDLSIATRLAGELGTAGLPNVAGAASFSSDRKHPHTVIYNAGITALAKSI